MEIQAAVVKEKGGAFIWQQMHLDEPRPNEVLVKIVATGMCHTDLVVRDQIWGAPLPIVLGHEGSGIVEAVGSEVTKVVLGDHVVLTFGHCGKCPNCLQGRPAYCYKFTELNFGGCRIDGSHSHHIDGETMNDNFFSQSSFATFAISPETNVVKVPDDLPIELLGPLGCGIQTGAGSILNALDPPAGSSIMISGTGAVGLSALMAAVIAGCTTIIAVDINDERLEFAKQLGATHTINPHNGDIAQQAYAIEASGLNFAFDTTGRPEVMKGALMSLAPRGVCGIVGGSPRPLDLDENFIVGRGITVKGIVEGDSIPDLFIPRLIALYRAGKFPFDKLIKFYTPDQINQAAEDSEKGSAIKPIIRIT